VERDEILAHLRERMVAFAASRMERDVAEDLAQEVLILLHEKYQQVARLEDLVPLSFQILRYKMLALRRKLIRHGEHTQVSVAEIPLPDMGANPGTQYERREMLERLTAAVKHMGERCRELLRLKLEGKSFPEIQAIFRVKSINTIYTWDHRCRKQLLELMGGTWEAHR